MSFYKNVRYLYVVIFFHNLIFAYVIERLFAIERGMTVQMVVYTEFIYAAATFALEVPSGVLADRLGRRPLLIAGALFTCLEFAVLPFAHGFWLFGLSALIAGMGGACISGTWNAMLYDSLLSCGRQNEFEKVLGRIQAADLAAALIAGVSGALLAQRFGFAFNYWLSVGSAVIALVFTLKLAEPPKTVDGHKACLSAGGIVTVAYRFFKTHRDVLNMIVHTALIVSLIIYVDEFWQVYLRDSYFPLALFGVVSAALTITRAPGALLAVQLLKRHSHRAITAASSFLAAGGIILAAMAKNGWGILGMAAVCFGTALMETVTAGYLHHRADPNARATIESAESMMRRVFSIGIGLAFGYVSTRFTIFTGFWLLGLAAAFFSLVFAVVKTPHRDRK